MTKKYLSPSKFNKLSREKRAILVAQDVIKQLNSKVYNTNRKVYVCYDTTADLDSNASEVIKSGNFTCTVCARGAMFISALKFKNVLALKDISNDSFSYSDTVHCAYTSDSTQYLSSEFDYDQQALIESTFEWHMFNNISPEDYNKCVRFRENVFKRFQRSKDSSQEGAFSPKFKTYLLKEICRNIIKNNGTFKP